MMRMYEATYKLSYGEKAPTVKRFFSSMPFGFLYVQPPTAFDPHGHRISGRVCKDGENPLVASCWEPVKRPSYNIQRFLPHPIAVPIGLRGRMPKRSPVPVDLSLSIMAPLSVLQEKMELEARRREGLMQRQVRIGYNQRKLKKLG
ncbi:uncharacterized protein LOC129586754 [Paramacrobiotus metropolitanus]|uniref:uncharacterized protein LOC129586754 n=1 Tax=Paramacrobiotus metropolitanus TaxID=2943436 RepID=UPI002445A9A2|nr:uncharacterized protein LOC129586754 [Paramacrobiotus metropolitanus]XP_055336112.1 uncharacterized protein LOC129586754 [Paramacrobiotus metropolitanus]XP_055336113.1 uncharacterized protein LOC129586754 [Paramacrobiotus metropolitanus]